MYKYLHSAQWLNSLVEGTNNYFDINIYFSHFFGLISLFLWYNSVLELNWPDFVCIEYILVLFDQF